MGLPAGGIEAALVGRVTEDAQRAQRIQRETMDGRMIMLVIGLL
jgi:hypothetical protein